MKMLIAAMLLATTSLASAQGVPRIGDPPKTINMIDNKTGEKIGSAIISGRFVIMRNRHGEHYATVIREPDGSKRWVDPDGKPIDPKTTLIPYD